MNIRPFVCVIAASFVAADATAQLTSPTSWSAPVASTRFGDDVALLHDLDGDGYRDILVGDRISGANAHGSVHVYTPNSAAGPNGLVITIPGAMAGGFYGTAVGPVPDYDFDGVPDFGVTGEQSANGRLFIYSGVAPYGLITSLAPPAGYHNFGLRFTEAGDYDLDGRPELIVSSKLAANGSGAVHFHWSSTGAYTTFSLTSPMADDGFGLSLSARRIGGNVCALLVGAPGDGRGSVTEFTINGAGATLVRYTAGAPNNRELGRGVQFVDDFDGDWALDTVAMGENHAVLIGSQGSMTFRSDAANWVKSLQDVDGDGVNEVLVGTNTDTLLVLTPTPSWPLVATIPIVASGRFATGEDVYGKLGNGIAIGGDANGGFAQYLFLGEVMDQFGPGCSQSIPTPPSLALAAGSPRALIGSTVNIQVSGGYAGPSPGVLGVGSIIANPPPYLCGQNYVSSLLWSSPQFYVDVTTSPVVGVSIPANPAMIGDGVFAQAAIWPQGPGGPGDLTNALLLRFGNY